MSWGCCRIGLKRVLVILGRASFHYSAFWSGPGQDGSDRVDMLFGAFLLMNCRRLKLDCEWTWDAEYGCGRGADMAEQGALN